MPGFRFSTLVLLAIVPSPAFFPIAAQAALIEDPVPRMTWQDRIQSELVVVGKYQSHKENELTILVERVLTGDVQAGDSLAIKLKHWWSVETGPVGFDARVKGAKGDGKPRICYKAQWDNPGPLVWLTAKNLQQLELT